MTLPQLTPEQFTYVDTKANIEALTGLVGGERGYATDTGQKGHYDAVGAAWDWGGGGGAVDSVNGQTGTVVLDYSDVGADPSGSAATAETNAKSYADGLVVGLWDDRGSYDASGGAYPSSGGSGTAGAILKGDIWTISVAGTLPTGQVAEVGDIVRALVDTPGNTQANWAITQNNIGYVAENAANKDTTMSGNESSNIVFLTAKAIYDWAVGIFSQLGHAHAASDVTSGTMATARLGSGTANSTTYLRGDQSWATVTVSGDGWNPVSWASPTRVSASSFTVAEDITGIIQKGYKLKYTDTTTKYATVYSVTFSGGVSTVTILVNTDYTIVGNPSAISWSNIESPFGFPDWFTFTTTVTCSGSMTWSTTANIGTKYRPFMNQLEIYIFHIGTTGGTASNRIYASLPVAPISPDATAKLCVTQVNDGWASTRVGCGYFESTGPRAHIYKADDSNFALSTNRAIFICGNYKY